MQEHQTRATTSSSIRNLEDPTSSQEPPHVSVSVADATSADVADVQPTETSLEEAALAAAAPSQAAAQVQKGAFANTCA